MKLDKFSVYPEVQQDGKYFVGRLYDGKGNMKHEVIKTNVEDVRKELDNEMKKYAVKENK